MTKRAGREVSHNMHYAFEDFFKTATGYSPYPYQKALANGKIPDMLSAPTGAGKTEAAVLCMWLWRRLNDDSKQNTPRRLVYCLPMRTLVEQTRKRINDYIKRLNLDENIKPRVITLMGGSVDRDYAMYPEDDAIIIGTQDMLLSRALNRGYAASPFRWPVEFGLLNNDCMWIMDEVQLMHNGLAASVQLDAFRKNMKTYGPHKTVWMSATIDKNWLDTVDSNTSDMSLMEMSEDDRKDPNLEKKNMAVKILKIMDFEVSGDEYKEPDVKKIMDLHVDGSLTLVIVNTVKRAQSIYRKIKEMSGRQELLLIHSRFRVQDRKAIADKLVEIHNQKRDAIVISTQVIEAGMDISARTLVTETAPWPSMIQRFGRCNRNGEDKDASVHVIMLKSSGHPPYDDKGMVEAAENVKKNEGQSVSPWNIKFDGNKMIYESIIRRPDLINLFDTTPDISGGYTDISAYVRSNERSRDVHVFWKTWNGINPPNYKAARDEMCNVPIGEIKKKNGRTYVYNHVKEMWVWINSYDMRPGQTILLHGEYGRYTSDLGWDPDSTTLVNETHERGKNEDSVSGDSQSQGRKLITLSEHTVNVMREMDAINAHIKYDEWPADVLKDAAMLHDIGKAYYLFQNAIKDAKDSDKIWAKCKDMRKYEIPNFRHEAVSAMAILKKAENDDDPSKAYLMAYVVAAHHGKVRMSMRNTSGAIIFRGKEYILGVPVGEASAIPNFLARSDVDKSLKNNTWRDRNLIITSDIAKVGKPSGYRASWIQITHNLLAKYGPFRLAYLETILRAADSRASSKEGRE